ncbi:HD-GYP domain-containing protein (c-di-GMP phosphodiesterase class II) [Devosia sp. UYZn731]
MIAGNHHERLDGKGYPAGLLAQEIDLDTRIVTTADIFDALKADRPYRSAMPASQAFAVMRSELTVTIDPACFVKLERGFERLERIAA